ncbi:hypothetical protein CHS0354_019366 [Potamilus streckersoni]|uniref:Uncharacterized protein n=1 Tax=Potamilus streckersoni TaxID=2493646 RepID=A0AAE0SHG8_9BIVA|nr:hypothetical protein CHS0354_019366 [Potamilus streckersoni]
MGSTIGTKNKAFGLCNNNHESKVDRIQIELENVKNRNALLETELYEMRKSPRVSSTLENSLREENRGLEKRFEETLIAVGNELAHLQRPITAFIMHEGGSVQVGDNNVMRIISDFSADINDNKEQIGKLEKTIHNLMDENCRLVRINADQRMLLYQTQTQCSKMRRNITRIANVLRMHNDTIDSKLSQISSLVGKPLFYLIWALHDKIIVLVGLPILAYLRLGKYKTDVGVEQNDVNI